MTSKAQRRRDRMAARHNTKQSVVETVTERTDDVIPDDVSAITDPAGPPISDRAVLRMFTPSPAPRRFKKARSFVMDGGFEIIITGEEDSLENDIYVEHESDRTTIYTGDAAIERRAAKQGNAPGAQQFVQFPPVIRSYVANHDSGAVRVPGVAYDGIGPSPTARKIAEAKRYDPQADALAEVGTSPEKLAAAMGYSHLVNTDDETSF